MAIENYTNILSKVITDNTSISLLVDYKNDLPNHIKNAISLKRRLRSQWQRHRDPLIKRQYNQQTDLVRDLLQSFSDNEWYNLLGSIDNRVNGWSKLHKLSRRLLRKHPAEQPLFHDNFQLTYGPQSISEIFADIMEEHFKIPIIDHPNDDFIYQTVYNHNKISTHTKSIFFSPGEVKNTIRSLPSKKAPGPDQISNSALKRINNKGILYITQIFNGCAKHEYFPSRWKLAEVIILPKLGKNLKIATNHRPISLINTMSKILERLILNRLNIYLYPKLRPEQYGFRPQHSTTLQLVNVIDDLVIHKNKR